MRQLGQIRVRSTFFPFNKKNKKFNNAEIFNGFCIFFKKDVIFTWQVRINDYIKTMEREFIKLPYSNLYVLVGLEERENPPGTFVDEIEGMVYMYSHVGFEGPTYYGIKIVEKGK